MFDPQGLILKASRGSLRQGEANALSIYVARLEREVQSAQVVRQAAAADQHLLLALTPEGSFAVTFPGHKPHTVTLPANAVAVDFLLKVLRERNGTTSHFIASRAAPTQADLTALARASKVKPKRNALDVEMSLEDIGL